MEEADDIAPAEPQEERSVGLGWEWLKVNNNINKDSIVKQL